MSVRAVLLDFFGTLVDYSPSRTTQGYRRSHALVVGMGATVDYDGFLAEWSDVSARLDERSAADDREYSMHEVGTAALDRMLDRSPQPDEVDRLVRTYLAEWNTGVSYPPWCAPAIDTLARSYTLAVVSNTHQPDLVPGHLAAMGIADRIQTVVTSIELGWRKPHPAIYTEALRRLDRAPDEAVFAGDNPVADYSGPRAAGITAYLVDPADRHGVPAAYRLDSVADLPARLGGAYP